MSFEDNQSSCPMPDTPSPTCTFIASEGETEADRVKCRSRSIKVHMKSPPTVSARSFYQANINRPLCEMYRLEHYLLLLDCCS